MTSDPNWQAISTIFKEIDATSKRMGDLSKREIQKFTEDYLRAQAIQNGQSRTIRAWPESTFPLEIFRLVFGRLTAEQVVKAMRVNR